MLFTKLLDVLCVAGCTLGYNSEQNMESSAPSLNSIFIKKKEKKWSLVLAKKELTQEETYAS